MISQGENVALFMRPPVYTFCVTIQVQWAACDP